MIKMIKWTLILIMFLNCGNVQAYSMTKEQVRTAIFAALHNDDPSVRAAAKLLKDKGLLAPKVSKLKLWKASKNKKVRAAVELLMNKGIIPKAALPKKVIETQPIDELTQLTT